MAITIDYTTFVISIPQADLALISGTLYKADTDAVRLELKSLESSVAGMVYPDTHNHNTVVTLFGVVYARTIEILAPYSIEFTPDEQWSVRLDGSNNNLGDVGAGILNQNQVQVIPTNSAGLQDLSTLLAAAYQGQVVVNSATGQAGTTTPIGTFFTPVNNMVDAIQIAVDNGIRDIVLAKSMTVNEDLSEGYNLLGTSPFNVLTVNPGANLLGTSLTNLTVQGELDGLSVIRDCSVLAITKVNGFLEKCAFSSTVDFTGPALIMECYSNLAGEGAPILTTVAGAGIQIRDYHGGLEIAGVVDVHHSLEGEGGALTIGPTCTGGEIHIRGAWFSVTDNSGVGCNVLDERGRGLTPAQDTLLTAIDTKTKDLHQVAGLESGQPLQVTDTSRVAGDVTQTLSDDGTTTTVTRT